MRKMKVFGINLFIPKQRRCIVATTTKKNAAFLMNISIEHLYKYGAVTANSRGISGCAFPPKKGFDCG